MNEPEIERLVFDTVRRNLGKQAAGREIGPRVNFRTELGIDSIGLLSLVFKLEDALGVDLFAYAERLGGATLLCDLVAVARDARSGAAAADGDRS